MLFVFVILIFIAQSAFCTLSAMDNPAHLYSAEYMNTMRAYGRHVVSLGALDDFKAGGVEIHNRFGFMYSADSDEALVKNFARLNEGMVVSTEKYRFSGLLRSAFFKGSSFGNNFQYGLMAERKLKLSAASSLDVGLAFTNIMVYNRLYPAPVPFPVVGWTVEKPSYLIRVGLPTALIWKQSRMEYGFLFSLMFNSKLYVKWNVTRFIDLELSAYTDRLQLMTGDPERDEVLNIFQTGFLLQARINVLGYMFFALGAGYDIPQYYWTGDAWKINFGNIAGSAGGSYVVKASVSCTIL